MEEFPNNNPEENTNQEPTDADVLANMPSFEEMRRQNAVPEGVRDEQDYREYQAEQQARSAEQDKADAEFAEHSKAYISEITKLENPRDRYMATASLRYLTDAENKYRQGHSEKAQNVMLDYFNRDNKDETLKNFIENRIYDLGHTGVKEMEEATKRYDLPSNYIDYLDKIERGAVIQTINDTEETEESVKELNELVFSIEGFGGELNKFTTSLDYHPEARPKSDRGIIHCMIKYLADDMHEHGRPTSALRHFDLEKLFRMEDFYGGESLDHQLTKIKKELYKDVMDKMSKEGSGWPFESPKVNYYANEKGEFAFARAEDDEVDNRHRLRDMMAVMQIDDEFKEHKKLYEKFQKSLAEGQQILDSFKNNTEA